jgi:hypothetical protein
VRSASINCSELDLILTMKITGPNSTSSVSSSKRKASARSGGQGFSVETADQAGAAVSTTAASSIQSVDAILALQSVGDFKEARQRATSRAVSLLDVLDELKIALLEGGVSKGKLVALMNLLQTQRDDTNDAALEAVLNEVETRAAVELAKFG